MGNLLDAVDEISEACTDLMGALNALREACADEGAEHSRLEEEVVQLEMEMAGLRARAETAEDSLELAFEKLEEQDAYMETQRVRISELLKAKE